MSDYKRGGAQLAEAVKKAYTQGLDDYHLEPMVLVENGQPVGKIHDHDSVVFCCRRGEREIELTEMFTEENMPSAKIYTFPQLLDIFPACGQVAVKKLIAPTDGQ